MSSLIDRIAVILFFFLVIAICLVSITNDLLLSLAASAVSVTVFSFIYYKFISKAIKDKQINTGKLNKYYIMNGNPAAAKTLGILLDAEYTGDYVLYGGKLIFPLFKSGKMTVEDFVKLYRIAKETGITEFNIITDAIERPVYILAAEENYKIRHIRLKTFYDLLKNRGALPELKKKSKPDKYRLITILENIFTKRNARRFLFASIMLLLMSFITFLKTYYYVLSGISAVLAVICYLFPTMNIPKENDIFK